MTRMILTAMTKDDTTHRIPNDNSNSNDTTMVEEDVFLNELVDKIELGKEEVTKNDIQQLASIMNSTTKKEKYIPYLNRRYWNGGNAGRGGLVRFVGMVQDMMDPEYYHVSSSISAGGVSSKYREYCGPTTNMEEDDRLDWTEQLAERQPMVIVPLPFLSPWIEHHDDDNDTTSSFCHGSSWIPDDTTVRKKRTLDDTEEPVMTKPSKTVKAGLTLEMASDGSTIQQDWWPPGCMGSDVTECPILAKLYYDEDNEEETLKLQLNDVVEVVGLLSLENPTEADFSLQQPQPQPQSNNKDMLLLGEDWLLEDQVVLPPPSLLPRVHVLHHQPWKASGNNTTTMMMQEERHFAIQTLAHHVLDGNVVAAEALLLTLLSTAEREPSTSSNRRCHPIRMPSGSTLGCASLQLTLDTLELCHTLRHRLAQVLPQLMPIVASITTTDDEDSRSAPVKNPQGRLEPSIFQLPKGSCVIVHDTQTTSLHERTLKCLSQLIQQHCVPYRFGGMMDLDFEADYSVIVVSSQQKALPPCDLEMTVELSVVEPPALLPTEAALRIRSYLQTCRALSNIGVTHDVLRRAEHDFLQRRSKHNQIGEFDFHRWLTLTRLQARSRAHHQTSLSDWTHALQLDDSMQSPQK